MAVIPVKFSGFTSKICRETFEGMHFMDNDCIYLVSLVHNYCLQSHSTAASQLSARLPVLSKLYMVYIISQEIGLKPNRPIVEYRTRQRPRKIKMAAVACGHRDLISDSGYYQTPTSVYYAVKQGKHVRRAIFPCWNDALQEIEGFEAAQYDSFHDLPSAVSYLLGGLREHAASDRQLETRMTLASEHFTPALSAVITNGNNGPQNPPSATIPVAAMDDEKRRAVCSTKMSRKRSRQSEEDGWTNMLEEFIQSRNTDRKKSRDLYQWINTQRTKYKNSELSKDRTKRLEEAGFEFTPKIHTFEERVEQLKTFKETHGHFKIPGSKTNGLSGFVTKLRTAHKKYAAGEKSSMTPEREQQLREIGFEFEVGKRYEQIPWEQRFQQLLEFKVSNM